MSSGLSAPDRCSMRALVRRAGGSRLRMLADHHAASIRYQVSPDDTTDESNAGCIFVSCSATWTPVRHLSIQTENVVARFIDGRRIRCGRDRQCHVDIRDHGAMRAARMPRPRPVQRVTGTGRETCRSART